MSSWKCRKCGSHDLVLLGRGNIRCNSCGALHWINPQGTLLFLPVPSRLRRLEDDPILSFFDHDSEDKSR
jgi:hypothetical protein